MSSKQLPAVMRAGATALRPIYPVTFEEVVKLARMSVMAGMIKPVKTGYGDSAQIEGPDATLARATMIILQGMELGLPPMQSVQLLAMINGRIVAHSEAVPGLLLSNGFKIQKGYEGTEFEDDFAAVCTLTRPDGDSIISKFSVKDAKTAGLWDPAPTKTAYGKTKPNDSAWHCYPKRLLWARALGFAAKDMGGDALKGLMVREEMEDILGRAVDVTPAATPLEPPDPDQPATDITVVPEPDDEPLADPDGLAEHIKDQLRECPIDELATLWADTRDVLVRLPHHLQHEIEAVHDQVQSA